MGLFGNHDDEDAQAPDSQQPTPPAQDGGENTPPPPQDNQGLGSTDLNNPGDVPPPAETPELPTPDDDDEEEPQNPVA